MEHEQIVLLCYLLLLLVVLDFDLLNFMVENLSPLGLELLLTHDVVICVNTRVDLEHGGIPVPQFEVDFAHVPLPGALVEIWEILRQKG